ncbi:MAG: tRNA 2-thiouridine(34) synthase MnmA [Nitrospira sp.]|nr:tRNA 2-thiouridine(34) synthase MnmA [Nitrospira sp.]
MPKVIVGMSGGVDSSVTAYLLKEKGYEVEGVSFILWEAGSRTDFTTCCSLQAVHEASRTARHIGIPHSIIDARDFFMEKVIEPFVDAYMKGSTPNPCILCNKFIKFPLLLKEAEKRGAEYIATGHYARVERSQKSEVRSQKSDQDVAFLKKGIDPKKDQSYVLYILRQEELKRLILPLGYYRKEEVRKIAQGLNLPSAQRSESQEICFIENKNYFKFIEKLSPVAGKPGSIVDLNGKVRGTHKGVYGYTIGQRKGLGISSPEPLYVVKIDAVRNTIYVGSQEDAKKKEFFVKDLNWINPPESPHNPPWERGAEGGFFRASVRVRSMMKDESATISLVNSQQSTVNSEEHDIYASRLTPHALRQIVRVVFDEPQWAPAPGQSAVFYDDDRVIGGGVIIELDKN